MDASDTGAFRRVFNPLLLGHDGAETDSILLCAAMQEMIAADRERELE
jgi:hypothetical protein